MTDSIEQVLHDLRFELPAGLVDRAKAAATDAAGARQAVRGSVHERRDVDRQRYSWATAVVAVLLALAIVATLLFVAHERQAVPVTPIPHRATSGATCDTQTSPPSPLKMLSPTTGWAHGALRTADGGLHWNDMSPPSLPNRTPAYAECFLDSNHAWTAQAVRSGTADADHIVTFATINGGQTWQPSVPVALGVRLCAHDNYTCAGGWGVVAQLAFIDAQQGWLLVGLGRLDPYVEVSAIESAVLYSTNDGGLHWTMVSSSGSVTNGPATNSCLPVVLGVTFVSPTSGFGQTCSPDAPALLVTHDGGVTWKLQRLPSTLVFGCPCEAPLPVFFNDQQGILLGDNVLLATSDGGSTWVERSLPPRITSCCGDAVWRVFQVDFLNASTGWAVAPAQGWTKGSTVGDWLYQTADGGQTWTLVQKDLPLGYPLDGLLIVDGNTAFAWQSVGAGNELLKTTDGGHTWKVVA